MTVNLYTISDDERTLNKIISGGVSLNCEIIYPSDVLNPQIRITASSWNAHYNYMYISELSRYYYITESTLDNGGAVIILGRVDPLTSYASEIKGLICNVVRQENSGITDIVDNQLTLTPKKEIETLLCDATPFNIREMVAQANYVLVIAGGEQGE